MTRDWRDDHGRLVPGHGLAAAGAEARWLNRDDALEALLRDWPELRDEASAKRRLSLLGDAASRGLLSGSQCGAAVRSVEVWLKARSLEIERDGMAALEQRITELQAALAAAQQGR